MSTAARLMPVLIRRSTFTSTPGKLTIAAFASTTALFIAVAGGTWAFFTRDVADVSPEFLIFYRVLAAVATLLLLIPAASLGMASAKLSARRQDERLSTLSLLGAPRGTIARLAIAEPLALATLGVAIGLGLSFLILLPLAQVSFLGQRLGYPAMLLPWWLMLAVVVVLLLVCVVSAASGLRRIVISPLGVRTRRDAPTFPWVRVILGVLALVATIAIATATQVVPMGIGALIGVFVGVIAAGLLVVNILGVLFVKGAAHLALRRARTPERLIASRLVIDTPKHYWNRVQGLAMTAFTATFAGSGVALMAGGDSDSADATDGSQFLGQDMFTGVLLTLGISFALITVSAVLNQAADIYDRSGTYADLYFVGMDPRTAHRANVAAVMSPVVWVSAFAGGLGLILAAPFAGVALVLSPLTFLVLLSSVVIGALIVRAGLQLTRPLVGAVARAPR